MSETIIPGCVEVTRNWLTEEEANNLFLYLESNISFSKGTLVIIDKQIPTPRTQAFFGDDDAPNHQYTGSTNKLLPWDPEIKKIRDRIDPSFNSCLVNRYNNGNQYIGYHSDKELDPNYQKVATVSLGQSRKFYLQPIISKKEKEEEKIYRKRKDTIKTILHSGDLVVMFGDCQKLYKHSIPKEKKATNPRISLTFRKLAS
jgi:alkylated DNA repair dioxygenase AlkB